MKKATLILIAALLHLCGAGVAQTPSRGVSANPSTGGLLWPNAAAFAGANDIPLLWADQTFIGANTFGDMAEEASQILTITSKNTQTPILRLMRGIAPGDISWDGATFSFGGFVDGSGVTNVPLATGVTGILGIANGGTDATTATGTGSVVLATSPALVTPALGTPASGVLTNCTGLPIDYVRVSDTKAAGSQGDQMSAGAWRTAVINTEHSDASGICSIAANQITLAAGTYDAEINVPVYGGDSAQARLRNVTDSATTLVSTSIYAYYASYATSAMRIAGRFTIATSKTFEIQGYNNAAGGTPRFGYNTLNTGETVTFTQAVFKRIK